MNNQIFFFILIIFLFLQSCTNQVRQSGIIDENVMGEIKKMGFILSSTDSGCLPDGVGGTVIEWDVKGEWITKENVIEIFIKAHIDYKYEISTQREKLSYQQLIDSYPDVYNEILNQIENEPYSKFNKFGLLTYTGKYSCIDALDDKIRWIDDRQKDQIVITMTEDFKEFRILDGTMVRL